MSLGEATASVNGAGPTKYELEAHLRWMHWTEQYDAALGCSYWPDPHGGRWMCCTCTDGARAVVHRFGGEIWGYPEAEDHLVGRPRLGSGHGGHDFAIIGPYLVDYWGLYVDESNKVGVFDLADPRVEQIYGPRAFWKKIDTVTASDGPVITLVECDRPSSDFVKFTEWLLRSIAKGIDAPFDVEARPYQQSLTRDEL